MTPSLPLRSEPARRRRRGVPGGLVALLMLLSLLVGLIAGAVGGSRLLDPPDVSLPAPSPGAPAPPDQDLAEGSVAGIAADVLPSTVYIRTRTGGAGGSGSGFVLREDGYIVTNHHVIAGAEQVAVVLADGNQVEAEIVGSTVDYDLAVLKVDLDGLEPLVLGDSDALRVGDPVVAIGAPLGLEGTVTSGIVSAMNRPVSVPGEEGASFLNAIQTDAAINPGNSGGPLVNTAGEVIGVNSAIASTASTPTSAGSVGLGFAIPSTQVRRTAEQLIETGTATYPIIGATLDAQYQGEGVQILTDEADADLPPLVPGGPAAQAGLEPGDIILAIDGEPVTSADELIVKIRAHPPGEVITLTVREDGDERQVEVTLGEQASE
ncbi:trypsin-like peptidase domain-containing protein [Ruania suaedae]|uniref:S1C family serine protease n=1 Tax=Ruania suaedae TaxID=2897774 RepID=UPI001E33D8D2|nr:trypsin-like peptidase domain-containing protein [Ruania suaedae]UFU03935.1 trypsin-like peptidase domain-containing protein [Ruania suaedae]